MGVDEEVCSFLGEMARAHDNLKLVSNQENVGTSRGRNQGARQAEGDWLLFIDNDIEVTSGWLEQLQAAATESTGACAPRIATPKGNVLISPPSLVAREVDGRIGEIGFRFERVFTQDAPEVNQRCPVPWFPTGCLMVHRGLFESFGGFDEGLFMAEEDKDLCLSIRETGREILYVPDALVVHAPEEKTPDYRAIRDNLKVLRRDLAFFETKWSCKVVMECRRRYLRELGMSDRAIDMKKRFDLFSTVLEDESPRHGLHRAGERHDNGR